MFTRFSKWIIVIVMAMFFPKLFGMAIELNSHYYPLSEDLLTRAIDEAFNSTRDDIINEIVDFLDRLGLDDVTCQSFPTEINFEYENSEEYGSCIMLSLEEDSIDFNFHFDPGNCDGELKISDVWSRFSLNVYTNTRGSYLKAEMLSSWYNDPDIDLWPHLWYQVWNYPICAAEEVAIDFALEFIAYIGFAYINNFMEASDHIKIDPYDLIIKFLDEEDQALAQQAINSFPIDYSFAVAPDNAGINELIINIDFMQGTSLNPTQFMNITPPAVTNPEFDLTGFSPLYYHLQGAYKGAFQTDPNLNQVQRATKVFNTMERDLISGYRIEAKWNKIQTQAYLGESAGELSDISIDNIDFYLDDSNYWNVLEFDSLHFILNAGFNKKLIPFMAIGVGHKDRQPLNQNGKTIAPNSIEYSGGDWEKCSKDEYLFNLKLYALATVREFADDIDVWQIENELNAAGFAAQADGWLREGDYWADESFRNDVFDILVESVRTADPTAKIIHDFHILGFMDALEDWVDDLDIIGINFYPNIMFAYPVLGEWVGEMVWATRRALAGLGFPDKEVWVTETGYGAYYSENPVESINLEDDLVYYCESRQKQFIEESLESSLLNGAKRFYYFSLVTEESAGGGGQAFNVGYHREGLIKENLTEKTGLASIRAKTDEHTPGVRSVALSNINASGDSIGGKVCIRSGRRNMDSGALTPLIVSKTYTGQSQELQISSLDFHNWYDFPNQFKIYEDFFLGEGVIPLSRKLIYKPKSSVTLGESSIGVQYEFRDPWRISNPTASPEYWIQPNSFQPISGSYDVFLNQYPSTDPNIELPIYSLKAPRYYADTEGIYELNGWVANPAADADFFSTSDPAVYNVVFKDEAVTVTPDYDPVNTIPNYTLSIANNQSLSIPAAPEPLNNAFIVKSIPYKPKETFYEQANF